MKMSRNSIVRFVLTSGVIAAVCLLTACADPAPSVTRLSGETMGTTYSIKLVTAQPLGEHAEADLQQQVDQRLVDTNQVFSTYIDNSEISQLNRQSGEVRVTDEMLALLRVSQMINQLSGGAFDVTVGPLVNLWGFGADGPVNGVPPQVDIDAALAISGFSKIELGEGVVTKPAALSIDLSAIAKGYAVDVVGNLIESQGVERYLVEIGGEVRARGDNERGVPWVIGLEAPELQVRRLQRTLPLRDQSMATSGDYRNYFEHNGQVYSHTIDPATGWPVTHNMASVTVLHPSSAWADGLATAFSVIGLDKTMAIAEEQSLPVLAIIRESDTFKEVASSQMRHYLAYPVNRETDHD